MLLMKSPSGEIHDWNELREGKKKKKSEAMCYRPTDCPSLFPQNGLNRSCREHANITACPLFLVSASLDSSI